MKLIFVLRHSKAANNLFGNDHERALTAQGKADSSKVAHKLKELDIDFDTVLASTAKRVVETLNDFISIVEIKQDAVHYVDQLYNAPSTVYYNLIEKLDDSCSKVLLAAHNPGITHFVNSLNIATIDHMPTTGLFGFVAHCNSWTDFKTCKKEFLYFDQPYLKN